MAASVKGKRFGLSVRTKGLIVFSALISYALIIAVFVFHEKNRLMHTIHHQARRQRNALGTILVLLPHEKSWREY